MTLQQLIAWQAQRIAELEQMIGPEQKLQLNESVRLHRNIWARFDGQLVVLESKILSTGHSYPRIFIPAGLMAHLFWFNRRVVDAFPNDYIVKPEDLSDEG